MATFQFRVRASSGLGLTTETLDVKFFRPGFSALNTHDVFRAAAVREFFLRYPGRGLVVQSVWVRECAPRRHHKMDPHYTTKWVRLDWNSTTAIRWEWIGPNASIKTEA